MPLTSNQPWNDLATLESRLGYEPSHAVDQMLDQGGNDRQIVAALVVSYGVTITAAFRILNQVKLTYVRGGFQGFRWEGLLDPIMEGE